MKRRWERLIWTLWLCQVRETVSLSQKAAGVVVIVLRLNITLGHCCVHPSPPNTTQYVYKHRTLFISLSPGHTFHNVSLLGPVTASCQKSWTHPSAKEMVLNCPADAAYLHAFTPVSITLSFSLSQRRPRLCPGHLFNLPSSENTFILHPCPLLHNIESISSRLCVSHWTLLSFSSHLRMLS